jgi:beta-xylosidase
MFMSSPDLMTWSDPIWAEPWGIDPSLFQDPKTSKTYLNLMAPNNNKDRIWGIYQCEVDLESGDCAGAYRSLWNGTLAQNASSRLEGPKIFYKDPYYYLLAAEGGTDDQHRSTIARSDSPEGPWEPAPNNPVLFNGRWGFDNLTVQSTGHGTFTETPDGDWFCSFLARRKINGSSPLGENSFSGRSRSIISLNKFLIILLGRETFLTSVTWQDGWPILNSNEPITLSQDIPGVSAQKPSLQTFEDEFCRKNLGISWYQLRVPYTRNYALASESYQSSEDHDHDEECGVLLKPNVFGLSDKDTPSALLRKQKSLNMTFSATLLPSNASLSSRQTVGISVYLSEYSHQDIGVKGCTNSTGLCVYTQLIMNTTTTVSTARSL